METDVPRFVYHGKRKAYNPEFVALWEPYLEEGMAAKHVGEIFGVSHATVYKYYPGRTWSHKQVVAHATMMKNHNLKMRKVTYV